MPAMAVADCAARLRAHVQQPHPRRCDREPAARADQVEAARGSQAEAAAETRPIDHGQRRQRQPFQRLLDLSDDAVVCGQRDGVLDQGAHFLDVSASTESPRLAAQQQHARCRFLRHLHLLRQGLAMAQQLLPHRRVQRVFPAGAADGQAGQRAVGVQCDHREGRGFAWQGTHEARLDLITCPYKLTGPRNRHPQLRPA